MCSMHEHTHTHTHTHTHDAAGDVAGGENREKEEEEEEEDLIWGPLKHPVDVKLADLGNACWVVSECIERPHQYSISVVLSSSCSYSRPSFLT